MYESKSRFVMAVSEHIIVIIIQDTILKFKSM